MGAAGSCRSDADCTPARGGGYAGVAAPVLTFGALGT